MSRAHPRGETVPTSLERTIGYGVGAAFGLMLIYAAWVLQRERAVDHAQAALLAQSRAIERGEPGEITPPDPITGERPARARVADALSRALSAQWTSPGPARDALLLDAANDLAQARRARPYWGEAATFAAFVELLKTDHPTRAFIQAISESYRQAPYLRDDAEWRVAQSLPIWDRFDPTTRERILNEAVWLSRMDLPLRLAVFDIARGSPAYSPFMVRWLATETAAPPADAQGVAP